MRASSPENVADLIVKPQEEYPPEPRYVSKYREKIIEASKRGKSAHKTMGVPPTDPDMPVQYLKKRSKSDARQKPLIDRQPDHLSSDQRKSPTRKPIKSSEHERRLPRDRKDLTSKSAKEARKSRPNRARRGLYCVDDRYGNSYPVMLSGMFPVYRNREGFGKVPGTYPPASNARSKSGRRNTLLEVPMVEEVEPRRSHKLEKSPRRGRSPGKMKQLEKTNQRGTRAREKSPKEGATRKDRRFQDKPRKSRKIEQSPKRAMLPKKERQGDKKTAKQRFEPTRRATVNRKSIENATVNENEEEKSLEENNELADENSQKKKKEEGKEVESSERNDSTSSESEVESRGTQMSEETSEDTTSTTASSKSKSSKVSTMTKTTISYHQPRCRYVDEDERAELLHGMKKKWDEMMNKFQCLPFVTDTQPKKKRKSQMEKELLQLEKDIKTIERHPYIYVYSDPED